MNLCFFSTAFVPNYSVVPHYSVAPHYLCVKYERSSSGVLHLLQMQITPLMLRWIRGEKIIWVGGRNLVAGNSGIPELLVLAGNSGIAGVWSP